MGKYDNDLFEGIKMTDDYKLQLEAKRLAVEQAADQYVNFMLAELKTQSMPPLTPEQAQAYRDIKIQVCSMSDNFFTEHEQAFAEQMEEQGDAWRKKQVEFIEIGNREITRLLTDVVDDMEFDMTKGMGLYDERHQEEREAQLPRIKEAVEWKMLDQRISQGTAFNRIFDRSKAAEDLIGITPKIDLPNTETEINQYRKLSMQQCSCSEAFKTETEEGLDAYRDEDDAELERVRRWNVKGEIKAAVYSMLSKKSENFRHGNLNYLPKEMRQEEKLYQKNENNMLVGLLSDIQSTQEAEQKAFEREFAPLCREIREGESLLAASAEAIDRAVLARERELIEEAKPERQKLDDEERAIRAEMAPKLQPVEKKLEQAKRRARDLPYTKVQEHAYMHDNYRDLCDSIETRENKIKDIRRFRSVDAIIDNMAKTFQENGQPDIARAFYQKDGILTAPYGKGGNDSAPKPLVELLEEMALKTWKGAELTEKEMSLLFDDVHARITAFASATDTTPTQIFFARDYVKVESLEKELTPRTEPRPQLPDPLPEPIPPKPLGLWARFAESIVSMFGFHTKAAVQHALEESTYQRQQEERAKAYEDLTYDAERAQGHYDSAIKFEKTPYFKYFQQDLDVINPAKRPVQKDEIAQYKAERDARRAKMIADLKEELVPLNKIKDDLLFGLEETRFDAASAREELSTERDLLLKEQSAKLNVVYNKQYAINHAVAEKLEEFKKNSTTYLDKAKEELAAKNARLETLLTLEKTKKTRFAESSEKADKLWAAAITKVLENRETRQKAMINKTYVRENFEHPSTKKVEEKTQQKTQQKSQEKSQPAKAQKGVGSQMG